MGIKYDEKTSTWSAYYGKRHPISRQAVTLRRKKIKSRAEALRIEKELVVKISDRLKRATTPTWSKMIDAFLEECRNRGLTVKTIYDYGVCLRSHTLGAWGDRMIDTITTQEVRQLLHTKLGERMPSHQRYFMKCIRAVFNHAVEGAHIVRNPTPQMKFKVGDKIQKVLTEEQACMLLVKAKEQNWIWFPHYALALYTGMRNGELYSLTWDKIGFDQRTILVNCAWNSKDGYKETKSGDDRIIEIAPALLPILRTLQEDADGSPYVLPHLYQWQKGEQAGHLKAFLTANGLPAVRFHDLRATWATILLSKGVEPIKVMKMGGWQNLETMMIYARKAGIDIRGAMDCLNYHVVNDPKKVLRIAEAL